MEEDVALTGQLDLDFLGTLITVTAITQHSNVQSLNRRHLFLLEQLGQLIRVLLLLVLEFTVEAASHVAQRMQNAAVARLLSRLLLLKKLLTWLQLHEHLEVVVNNELGIIADFEASVYHRVVMVELARLTLNIHQSLRGLLYFLKATLGCVSLRIIHFLF